MKKRLFVLTLVLLFVLIVPLIVSANSETVITEAELPCSYTELYADLAIESPVFFDTLTCMVQGSDEPKLVSGFTWTSEDYQADTVGTYTFTAVAPEGYVFAEGKTPAITVRVRQTGSASGVKGKSGFFFSTDAIAGFNVLAVSSDVAGKVSLRDVTGHNKIYSADASNTIKLVAGVEHRSNMGDVGKTYVQYPTELTAKIGLNGTTIHSMYGGSFANIFKGTTDISITNGALTDGVYAGCYNYTFEGKTNIHLSGECEIPKLVFGSYGSSGSYKGEINVYIADDFSGTIGEIVVPSTTSDETVANIHMSSTCQFDITAVTGYENITLYIDGVEAAKYISELVYNGPTTITVPKGTAVEDIVFEDSWTAKDYDGNDVPLSGVIWECAEYIAENVGDYTFVPVLPEGYEVPAEVTVPTVAVRVRNVIEEIELPCSYTELYDGSKVKADPQFYGTLAGKVNGAAAAIENITWTSSPEYTAEAGKTYIFTAEFSEGYVLAEGVDAPQITVKVRTGDANGVKGKSGYFYSSDGAAGMYAMVKSTDGTVNTFCDMTGFNKIYSANPSKNIKLVAGVGANCSETIENLTAKIGLDGATINSLYGGSYNNIYKGTTDIFVTNGAVTAGIYAGSYNGAFEGTTNIYLSGNSTIPKLILGSSGTGNSYKGTINVYIADDFTGTIGAIEAATGENDNVAANIYLPDGVTDITLPSIVGGSKVNLYVGNSLVSKTATSVVYDGETTIRVNLGTEKSDIEFADTIQFVCGNVTYTEKGIKWVCDSYDADTVGDYVFTPILPDCYKTDSIALPSVTVSVMAPSLIIESVLLPFNYTELYADLNIAEPVFYDSLVCTVKDNTSLTVLSGFTWTSSDYQPDTVGTYTFTAVPPVGYVFAEGLTPTITVRVRKTGDVGGLKGPGSGYFCATDSATGVYAMAVNSNASSPVQIRDITGNNLIYKYNGSKNVKLVAGVAASTDEGIGAAYAANPTELTAKIGLSGTSLHSLYGGSFKNIYKGTTDIYVENGILSDGIYAGSIGGAFEGTTNIYLSGDCQIPTLNLGSTGTGSSYVGTINVYLADDFTGGIGKIVVPNGENDQINANIYMSSNCAFNIFNVGYEGVTLYIDGQDASNYMSEIDYNGSNLIVVNKGTAQADVLFDGVLKIVYGGKRYTETEFGWACDNYSADVAGVYTFKPILPSQYQPTNQIELPEVKVVVAEAGSIQIDSIDVGVALATRIPVGVTTLNTPNNAIITYTYDGEVHTAEISVSYNTEGYVPETGEYVLTLESVQAPFALPENVAETADIKVEVTDVTARKSGDVYFFENAPVKVVAETRGSYTITDAAGLYTYYDDVAVIYAMELSGNAPEIIIESPLVYVESDITFIDVEGLAKANVANSLVTMIRTQSPEKVEVNGVLLDTYSEKIVTEIANNGESNSGTFFFNGIPGIIVRSEDGGTYAYRSYDMHKLSETNLAGWDVSGGSYGNDTVTERTNIRFVSGMVNRLFGAGQGTTLDSTIVFDGGAVNISSFGGAMEGGTVKQAMIVYEYGDSKYRAYIGGLGGSVMGDPNKAYKDDEYVAEVWWFDFATQYCYLGGTNGGNVYGNIRFEQYGGSHLNVITGGENANLYGDVNITVYGGLWEKTLKQTAQHYGDVYVKINKDVGWGKYPVFAKENNAEYTLDIEWFDYPYEFPFVEVSDQRDEIIDTSEDAGKLVIRFLETKLSDGSDKGVEKIRDGTGDCIYITFPNGQNMLIDTGTAEGAQYIVQDLRDLGVTKLDYLMISHRHGDHFGGISAVCEAFEVETLLYQKYLTPHQDMLNAIESEQAEVIYLGLGDTLDIGEVHFDFISPIEEIVQTISEENCRCIAFVMTYGDSKTLLSADSLREVENVWLADEELKALISNCQLFKLNHHAICNANGLEFLATVNAEKYAVTQMREYGTQLAQTIAALQGAFGVTWDDIYVTGKHGMIKAVVGKDGTVDMSGQYVKTTPYYADYSALDTLVESVDESVLPAKELERWDAAVARIKRYYAYEDQLIVDGLYAYILDVVEQIIPEEIEILTEGTDKSYTLGTNSPISIHCSGELSELESVEVDNLTVEQTNYTTREGSTIVTFKATYLETLSEGDHTVTLNYSGGRSVHTLLTVAANPGGEVTTEPTEPGSEVTTEPTEPGSEVTTEPTEPGSEVTTEPTEPSGEVTIEPTEPSGEVTTEPTEPGGEVTTEPTEPGGEVTTDPTEPGGEVTTEPTEPGGEDTTVPTEPGDETENGGRPGDDVSPPDTGDINHIELWILVLVISFGMGAGIFLQQKRNNSSM